MSKQNSASPGLPLLIDALSSEDGTVRQRARKSLLVKALESSTVPESSAVAASEFLKRMKGRS